MCLVQRACAYLQDWDIKQPFLPLELECVTYKTFINSSLMQLPEQNAKIKHLLGLF